jgi:hypothetical protein
MCARPSHLSLDLLGEIGKRNSLNGAPSHPLYGQESLTAKLTDKVVQHIRGLRAQGIGPTEIHREGLYQLRGVPPVKLEAIMNALNGHTFPHLPIPFYPKVKPQIHFKNIGERNGQAKLQERTVRIIKQVLKISPSMKRHNCKVIAARLGVSWKTIQKIETGERWASIKI